MHRPVTSPDAPAGLSQHSPGPGAPGLSGAALVDELRARAAALGFARVGVAPADVLVDGARRLEAWRAQGFDAGLGYMREGSRADPRTLLPSARSVVVAALAYPTPTPLRRSRAGEPLTGAVAAYARGTDYHLVMKQKLRALADALAHASGRELTARIAVDTAPLLERELAARAGVGFVGKSTLLIVPGVGTNVVLGELVTDLDLEPGAPLAPGCGSCRACLDACPTGALVAPFSLDARRCISTFTIEHHGVIPLELRPRLGTRVFGCDECQAVCPFDASASPPPHAPELAGRIPDVGLPLLELVAAGNAQYRKRVRRTALRRVSRDVLARNAAVALANAGDPAAVAVLSRILSAHPSPLVRGHAAWAIGRLGGPRARAALVAALEDPDRDVREEARVALANLDDQRAREYP